MLENEYYYELKYVYKDKVVTVKFNGEKNFNEVVENIQDFLKSAGWQEDTVKRQIKTESDLWEEAEDNKETDNSKKEDETYYQEYNCPDNNYEFKNNINYYDYNYKYDINNDYYQYDNNNDYYQYDGYEFNDYTKDDNSEREDLKPEYYKTSINCGEYKNNVNCYQGYEFNDNKD